MSNQSSLNKFKTHILFIKTRVLSGWQYVSEDVWRDTRDIWWVNICKTLNLSIRSFLNTDIQSRACAMAFRTMLAIVPALALLFAIGRGFGFQDIIKNELYGLVPAQQEALSHAMTYVDSYLSQTSEGLFVGVGIAFLLYTVISLLINVEDSFNRIWNVRHGRSIWRKLTDYTAILLILPVLMICGSGLTIFVSSTLPTLLDWEFITPLTTALLEGASWIFTWLFFAGVYILIPNTKVKKSNALIAGVIAGTGFLILQWLFVSGQLYVTRYNAIYGSFALIPLLLIWLQLTWVITLSGALLCYASQNISRFSFQNDIDSISAHYRRCVALAVCSVVVKRFKEGLSAPTELGISIAYSLPSQLTSDVCDRLIRSGVLNTTIIDAKNEIYGLQPAMDISRLTVKYVYKQLDNLGRDGFIAGFDKNFKGVIELSDKISDAIAGVTSDRLIGDLEITPEEIALDTIHTVDHVKFKIRDNHPITK
ncbi:MAG: YihY/virulence factor BrkB family protein [Muribaculaceae bacterium]|nr:YihY/virulence factor BrkB family protein [Muribaculaceae bacterium]